jgi:hypothetical protein
MWGKHGVGISPLSPCVPRMGRDEKCIRSLVSKPEGKGPLGTIILGCKVNINTSEGSRMLGFGYFNVD